MIKFKNYAPNILKKWSFLALVAIPMDRSTDWHLISFDNIPANKMVIYNDQITLSVNNSASPLIYSLKDIKNVTGFKVEAVVAGTLPQIPEGKQQGVGAYDDFTLKMGLITKGEQKLTWAQRLLAPSWIKEMEKLVPKPYGIKDVRFYSTCRQKNLLEKPRKHPLDSRLKEVCILHLTKTGKFKLERTLKSPLKVIGLWIGTDGDNTHSNFQVTLKKIQLNYK